MGMLPDGDPHSLISEARWWLETTPKAAPPRAVNRTRHNLYFRRDRMKKALQLASLLTLGISVNAAAQHPQHPATAAPHVKSAGAGHEAAPKTPAAKPTEETKGFRGIAEKLHTTPQALEASYDAAKAANPNLTHGQFIAANVVAQNLGEKNPAVTTQALLDGLKSGKSIGQTLRGLKVSDKEADEAERAADKAAKEAEKDADKAAKPAEKQPD